MAKLYRYLIPCLIGTVIYLIPTPEGLSPKGWGLLAVFVATIAALVTKPLPMGGITLISLAVVILTGIIPEKETLKGFSSSVSWLIVFVFCITRGFIKTGLGSRIAYLFTLIFGRTTLGLAYSLVITELLISPVMPSSAARAGGVIYPIFRALADSVGSMPHNKTARRLGAFLSLVCFNSNYITSTMFLTAMAANPIIQSFAASQNISISWGSWALASSVPALLSLIIIPLFIYYIYPPELKIISNSTEFAREKLQQMGPISRKEKLMVGIFIFMLILWVGGDIYGINITTTALLGVCLLLLTSVITINDILAEDEAWHTLLWFSILIMLSQYLEIFGVVSWFSKLIGTYISDLHWSHGFIAIFLVYFYSHYFFASITAHVSTMYATFLALSISIGAPPLLAALALGFSSNLFSSLTHYGSSGAVIFSTADFVPVRTWWRIGFLTSLINLAIWGIIGSAWWKFLNIW